jgi:hypothetical protein
VCDTRANAKGVVALMLKYDKNQNKYVFTNDNMAFRVDAPTAAVSDRWQRILQAGATSGQLPIDSGRR